MIIEQHPTKRPLLFFLFFISGFCALVYQVVWTRLAFASFGVITPVLSVVLSVFMLGLALGAWAGGRWIAALVARTGVSAVSFYGLAEFMIACGAFVVPASFHLGQRLLLSAGASNSTTYLSVSAVVLGLSLLPWCFCMGATFPLMMAYLREQDPLRSEGFSFLYLANVLGATSGTVLTAAALVELFGFSETLRLAGCGNLLIALIGLRLGRGSGKPSPAPSRPSLAGVQRDSARLNPRASQGQMKLILFSTGFISMASEVVWTRAFAPVLKTQVYSFALIVATYLAATFVGSLWYRHHLRRGRSCALTNVLGLLCVAAVVPNFVNELCFPWQHIDQPAPSALSALLLMMSICPFCGILGYLTPWLIDQYAAGAAAEAGRAYALNILGCILGPLAASYLLLPNLSESVALVVLAAPLLAILLGFFRQRWQRPSLGLGLAAAGALAAALFFTDDFAGYLSRGSRHVAIRRDYAASVVSFGAGLDKQLLVNGNSMTRLTPVTKFMAHLPLAFHHGTPDSALVICFGMGTTFRSCLSWNVQTTAVELIPSVKSAFPFYYSDAARCLQNPKGTVVIDDGRRYLERTPRSFDVIIVDPPPPVEAAGSSLLYSKEFYRLAITHLRPYGILQAWVPQDAFVGCAALRSLREAFPYVRCFHSVKGWGLHMLASMRPIDECDPDQLAARFPSAARNDLLEWSPGQNLPDYVNQVLSRETGTNDLLKLNAFIRITDDQPFNEYFLLRKFLFARSSELGSQ